MALYRVIKSQDYVTMANYHLRDPRLTMAAKGLLSVLLAEPGDGSHTVADLAGRGPEGKDAVRSALKRLEEAGYMTRSQGHDENGRFGNNVYLIFEAPLSGNPTTVSPGPVPLSGFPSTVNPTTVSEPAEQELNNEILASPVDRTLKRENKEDNLIPPTKDSPQEESPQTKRRVPKAPSSGPKHRPERFAGFWKYYPRGENKQGAIKAWDALKPSEELIDTIAADLRRKKETEEWRRGIGIPYASTYLNQRRWEDEVRQTAPAEPTGEREREVREWTPR